MKPRIYMLHSVGGGVPSGPSVDPRVSRDRYHHGFYGLARIGRAGSPLPAV